jgi:hypothetical protein
MGWTRAITDSTSDCATQRECKSSESKSSPHLDTFAGPSLKRIIRTPFHLRDRISLAP